MKKGIDRNKLYAKKLGKGCEMYKTFQSCILSLALVILLINSVNAQNYPAGDLNGDFKINASDLYIFADQWLDPSGCSGLGCADLYGQNENGVNFIDFTLLAQNWGKKFLFVSEFMASNDNTIEDPEEPGESPDWIEIYNASDKVVDLSGMYLTDDPEDVPAKWKIPDGITVDPNNYIIFWADDDDEQGDRHTNFKLGADGDDVALFSIDPNLVIDCIDFGNQYADISFGRYPDNTTTWRFMGLPTPGWKNDPGYLGKVEDLRFSVEHGFYSQPFQVRIATDTPNAAIRYTTDGSDPVDPNGSPYNPDIPIQITETTCLRAAAYKAGWLQSKSDTQTYIFLSDIINQPATAPSPDWPPPTTSGQWIDYEMDPDVTSNPDYNDLIDDALLAIPTICLSTDLENLFDPTVGIYVNCGWYGWPGWERGEKWERPVSVELINPDGSEGFQINAGLRMRGITSCRDDNPKHAFRLFFSAKYDGDLEYPLFGDEGVDVFENVDLRCAANYSWNFGGDSKNTYVREVFCRDLQGQMDQPYTKSRYYHLYINGVYWGLYQTQERANSNHGQAYFGDDSDDYDVVKSNRSWPRSMECTDGTFDAYERLWLACQDGFNTDLKYYKVQGLNTDGTPNPAYERLVDAENIIDYMLTIFYSGDFDAPISAWYGSNQTPNNFFGIYNRVNPDGFKYFRHDGEHTLLSTNENRTGTYTHSWLMTFIKDCPVADDPWPAYTCVGFNPQTIHQYLIEHPEYKMEFSDHVHKFFFNDGPMSINGAQDLFASRASEIDMAIIAESARWGDAKTSSPLTKNHWLGAITWVLDSYMPTRTDIVINQLKNKGWYPNIDAPEFKVNDSFQHGGYITPTDSVSISAPSGTIYYTTDGSDPRSPASPGEVVSSTLIPENAPKKVFVPTEDIGTTWRGSSEPYNDDDWDHGTYISGKTGGVGYDNDTTYLPYITYDVKSLMYGKMASCYIRIPFTVEADDLAAFNFLALNARCDDGLVAFINGYEVTSINKPESFVWNSNCANRSDDTSFATLPISQHLGKLNAGQNILAIHAMNQSTTSSDFLISVELIAGIDSSTPPMPSPAACEYTAPFTLNKTTNLKARVIDSNNWSALCDAIFAIGPVAENLSITEIMYHPQDTNDPNDPNTEFIELRNIGAETINLNLVKFTNGFDFTFPDVNLTSTQNILIVKDINAFEAKYSSGLNIAGQYTGSLANEGERIRIVDALGTTILDFRYQDGWRSNTDGDGYSLTIINPLNPDTNSWSAKDSWRPSAYINGSPGYDDNGIIPNPGDVVINEVLSHTDTYPADWIELHNTTDHSINITDWYLSDNDVNLTKYKIPSTTIPANGYVVFTQDDHFGAYFALSENGEMICLTSKKDAQDNLTGYRQKEDFGASENNIAFGRYYKESTDNYNFIAMSENTPGLSFEGAPNAYPKVGPVVISEIMYHPEIFWGNWDAEYIELYNITDSSINIYDGAGNPWKFTDGIEFEFPPATSIPAKSCLLVVKDIAAFNSEYPGSVPEGVQIFQWESGRLDNAGEKIEISMPGDIDGSGIRQYIRIDRINYSDGAHPEDFNGITDPWPADADGTGKSLEKINLNLYGNDPNNWDANNPSPGIIPAIPSEWTILTYDDFETGWGNYTPGGEDALLDTSGYYAHQDNNAANIQVASGDASSFYHTNPIDVDTPAYTQIKVNFWFYAVGMEPGENFQLLYYDGSSWQTIETFTADTDFENNNFYFEQIIIDSSAYNFPTDMKLKFQCNASSSTDDIYIDEIAVRAK